MLQRRRLHKTKDTIWEGAPKTSQQIAGKASQAKGTVLEGSLGKRHCKKGAQVKDTIVERAQKSTQYVAEKGAQVKDTIVESDKKTSEYVAEKAVTAKDVIAQNGKKVVRCVEKVTKNLFIMETFH
ncbi:hypothetical protein Peur_011057 [Populus x canadensis]